MKSSPALAAVILAGCSLLPAGCTDLNHNNASAGVDPLLGGPGVRPLTQTPAQAPAPVAAQPLTPAANPALSTAALAAATPRPMDSGNDLRIGGSGSGPASDAWAGQAVASTGAAGATLQRPQMTVEPASRTEPVPAGSPTSLASAGPTTYDQVQAQLKARGLLWQQSTFVNETSQWEFRCSLPNRQNPRIRRTYIGRGPDSLSAMRAVLDQIDKEPQ